MHGSGIGNYVAEFAEGQGAQSLHVYLMPLKGSQPIHPRVGQPAQQRPFNHEDEPRSRYLQSMFSNLLRSDWTMFDLRPLRRDLNTPGHRGGAVRGGLQHMRSFACGSSRREYLGEKVANKSHHFRLVRQEDVVRP